MPQKIGFFEDTGGSDTADSSPDGADPDLDPSVDPAAPTEPLYE